MFEKSVCLKRAALAKINRKKIETAQIIFVRNKRVDFTTNPKDVKRSVREYYKHLYVKIANSLDNMDKFLKNTNYQTYLLKKN